MENVLFWTQVTAAVLMILAILLQQKNVSLSAAIGGSESAAHTTARGVDKLLGTLTVIFAIVFFGTALAVLFV